MQTTYNVYEIETPSGYTRRIVAKSSTAAKREFCRKMGRSPSDPWCGMTALKARKVE